MNLLLEEQEPYLNLSTWIQGMWFVHTDNPAMQRKLESIGATLVRSSEDGIGKIYSLSADLWNAHSNLRIKTEYYGR